ncbi:hypothetical protein DFH06DRAFT_1333792 [Mycena polygramma]|nr:hypothetical protein DFH06DRAFT_1333792 [Mycena polygramma]
MLAQFHLLARSHHCRRAIYSNVLHSRQLSADPSRRLHLLKTPLTCPHKTRGGNTPPTRHLTHKSSIHPRRYVYACPIRPIRTSKTFALVRSLKVTSDLSSGPSSFAPDFLQILPLRLPAISVVGVSSGHTMGCEHTFSVCRVRDALSIRRSLVSHAADRLMLEVSYLFPTNEPRQTVRNCPDRVASLTPSSSLSNLIKMCRGRNFSSVPLRNVYIAYTTSTSITPPSFTTWITLILDVKSAVSESRMDVRLSAARSPMGPWQSEVRETPQTLSRYPAGRHVEHFTPVVLNLPALMGLIGACTECESGTRSKRDFAGAFSLRGIYTDIYPLRCLGDVWAITLSPMGCESVFGESVSASLRRQACLPYVFLVLGHLFCSNMPAAADRVLFMYLFHLSSSCIYSTFLSTTGA